VRARQRRSDDEEKASSNDETQYTFNFAYSIRVLGDSTQKRKARCTKGVRQSLIDMTLKGADAVEKEAVRGQARCGE
jgi:hypothetical protein